MTNSETSSILLGNNYERPPNYKFNSRMIVKQNSKANETQPTMRAKRHPGKNTRLCRVEHEWWEQILKGPPDDTTESFNQQMLFSPIDWKSSVAKFFDTSLLDQESGLVAGDTVTSVSLSSRQTEPSKSPQPTVQTE